MSVNISDEIKQHRDNRIKEIINYTDNYNRNLLFYFDSFYEESYLEYKIDKIHLELYTLIYEECIDENNTEDLYFGIIQKLLNYNLDINKKDIDDIPLLFYYFKSNLRVANFLIDNGADINISINNDRDTELTLLELACEDNNPDLVEYLISKGLDINFSNMYNQNALHYLCMNTPVIFRSSIPIYDVLYLFGIDINQQDEYGNTPLHYACMYNTIHIVYSLIYNGANVNMLNNFGQSPFMVRLENKENYTCDNINSCLKLLEEGAELGIIDNFGISDYEYALKYNAEEIIEVFKNRPEVIDKIRNFKINILKEQINYIEIKLFDNIINFILE